MRDRRKRTGRRRKGKRTRRRGEAEHSCDDGDDEELCEDGIDAGVVCWSMLVGKREGRSDAISSLRRREKGQK
jgi:hypothetical protein